VRYSAGAATRIARRGASNAAGFTPFRASDLDRARQARDRTACNPVAPPEGLNLMPVDY